MFRKAFTFIFTLIIFAFSYADSIIVAKKGNATYIQYSQFLLAQGETVIGPIQLLVGADIGNILIKPSNSDIKVLGYISEPASNNLLENLVGKTISVEGEGRVIRGTVISVKDEFITLDTKNGVVIITIPKFPNRISSSLKWQDLLSPRITIKLSSNKPTNAGINLIYPITGFQWDVVYSAEISGNKVILNGFYKIINSTPVKLNDVNLYIKDGEKVIKLQENVIFESYTSKNISIDKVILPLQKEIKINSEKYFPDGKVAFYKNNVYIGNGIIVNKILKLP